MSDKELLWHGKPLEYRKPSPVPFDPIFEELDDRITALTAERDALARTLATLAAAGITTGEDGEPRFHGLTGAEIERYRVNWTDMQTIANAVMDALYSDDNHIMQEARHAIASAKRGIQFRATAAGRGADGEATK